MKPNITGVLNPKCKLSEVQVLDIRQKYKNGNTLRQIANFLVIPPSTIFSICHRKSWKHI